MDLLVITLATFGFFGSLVYVMLGPRGTRAGDVVRGRLQAIAGSAGPSTDVMLAPTHGGGFWENLAGFFADRRPASGAEDGKLSRLLHQAGYRPERTARMFIGLRLLAATVGATAAFFVAAAFGASFFRLSASMAAAAGLASIVPLAILQRKARLRLRDMDETFPDTLDLLVVCVEAGLGIDSALLRVAEEQASHGLAIGHELLIACRESQAGLPRREALTRMATRLGSDPIHSLTRFLVQTEELGGSIARSLRVYATTMRQRRRQKAEELVRKMVIRLLFPLALLIMPALFLVVFAPPAVNIVKFVSAQKAR